MLATRDDAGLLAVEHAAKALAACTRLDDAKEIRDKAVAVRDYWKRQRGAGGDAAASAARIVALADIRMGQLLAAAPKASGSKGQLRGDVPKGAVLAVPTQDSQQAVPTLREQGITRNESSRLQTIAAKVEADPKYAERFVEQQAAKASKFVSRTPGTTDDPDHDADTADAWETPDSVIALVRAVLGEIDLDAASNLHAQKRIRALNLWTKRDDSLAQEWRGNVFVNPPYSMPLVQHFAEKLVAERAAGRVKQGIFLVDNNTDAAWFQALARASDAICFHGGRIPFVSPLGHPTAPRRGQALFYVGGKVARFIKVFGAVGVVLCCAGKE